MTAQLVTVGIPTLRRLPYLIEAVDAALAQTWSNLEVLVSDDGDRPEIREWCLRRAQDDARLRYQRNATRLGLAGNWNAIVSSASGEFVALPGDDDRLLPEFVERLMAAASAETAVVFCNHHIIDGQGRRVPEDTERIERRYHRHDLARGRVADPAVCAWQLAICPSAVLIRRRELLRLGFRDELNSPDVEFFIRLAGESARFDFVPDRLSEFRFHGEEAATAGGLRHDDLLARLLPIDVPAHIEPHKRALIEGLIVNAVSRSLQKGDRQRAREFLRSEYYPRGSRAVSRFVQSTCAALPGAIGSPIYRALVMARRTQSSTA